MAAPQKLVRVRECDGACCRESPRFPNESGDDCVYHDHSCQLQRDPSKIPEGHEDLVIRTCLQWPHVFPAGRSTGGCCWQWVIAHGH